MSKNSGRGSWQIPIAITCMLLGIAVTMMFKQQAQADFPMMSSNRNDMIKMVHDLEQQKQKLEVTIEEQKKAIRGYEAAAGDSGTDMLEAMKHQLDTLRTEAGYTDVAGPGVTVILKDSSKRPAPNEDEFFFRIHDVDIATLVNELWASGAEAISVNSQRIVINTPIRCVGPTILINTARIGPPYEVNAIGPAEEIEGALKMTGGFIDYMSPSTSKGVRITIARKDSVKIPAFKGSMILRHAKQDKADKSPETKKPAEAKK
ncbi:MAG: DUF881 domain-containing protein [bacterium]|nr:DUF881 domain-containing protein [bacterium]